MVAFGQKVRLELQNITGSQEKENIEVARAAQSEANNWLETSRIISRTDRSKMENKTAFSRGITSFSKSPRLSL